MPANASALPVAVRGGGVTGRRLPCAATTRPSQLPGPGGLNDASSPALRGHDLAQGPPKNTAAAVGFFTRHGAPAGVHCR